MKASSPRRRPLPTPQLPFLFFRTAFFMAPGGQAPQRASQSRSWSGSNSQLFRTREEPAHCGPTAGGGADRPAARRPRALLLGMAARGQKLDNCAVTRPRWTPESGVSGNLGGEKQNLCGRGGEGGSRTSAWFTVGSSSILGKQLGRMEEALRRVWQRCEMVCRGRS